LVVPALSNWLHPWGWPTPTRAVIATFARSQGGIPDKLAFDLRVTSPLPPAAVLTVHTEGEKAFEGMGRCYPAGFVDVAIGRWKELTGED
jgi:hypothetical protein